MYYELLSETNFDLKQLNSTYRSVATVLSLYHASVSLLPSDVIFFVAISCLYLSEHSITDCTLDAGTKELENSLGGATNDVSGACKFVLGCACLEQVFASSSALEMIVMCAGLLSDIV